MISYQEILLLIIGFILGTISSICVTRVFQWYQHREQYAQVLNVFRFNLDRMNQMVNQLAANEIPNYLLDTTILDTLFSCGPEPFESPAQFEKMNWCRYQMHHINNKLSLVPFIFHNGIPQNYLDELSKHITGETENIKKILERT